MADDYKEKLRVFLNIPMWPKEIRSGEPQEIRSGEAKTPPYDEAFKKQLDNPNFTLPTNKLFLKYTGTSHLAMVKDWAHKGHLTACNGLAGTCGKTMGAKDYLGQFELEDFLRKIGKGHAWVPADSGQRPDYGDIFRAVVYHMGVSLGFEGGDWLTVEAGHGGPGKGYDVLQRIRKPFDPSVLQGWCNMRLYLDPRPPLPNWLIGMWIIYCGNEKYYY